MRGYRLPNVWGGLSIYEEPRPGGTYSIGVDSGSGVRASVKEGDPSAAVVIEVLTCREVALWHGYYEPQLWGMKCSRLGWYYNTAALGFETHPSKDGLAAFNAAERYGYPRLAMQERMDVITKKWSQKRGWTRAAGSTILLLNRIKVALREGCPIRSERLLDELAAFYQDGKDIQSSEHDDAAIAYGIALEVRDQVLRKGEVKPEEEPIEDIADAYWKRELEADRTKAPAATLEEEWNGV